MSISCGQAAKQPNVCSFWTNQCPKRKLKPPKQCRTTKTIRRRLTSDLGKSTRASGKPVDRKSPSKKRKQQSSSASSTRDQDEDDEEARVDESDESDEEGNEDRGEALLVMLRERIGGEFLQREIDVDSSRAALAHSAHNGFFSSADRNQSLPFLLREHAAKAAECDKIRWTQLMAKLQLERSENETAEMEPPLESWSWPKNGKLQCDDETFRLSQIDDIRKRLSRIPDGLTDKNSLFWPNLRLDRHLVDPGLRQTFCHLMRDIERDAVPPSPQVDPGLRQTFCHLMRDIERDALEPPGPQHSQREGQDGKDAKVDTPAKDTVGEAEACVTELMGDGTGKQSRVG